MKTVLSIQSHVAGACVGNSAAGFALQRLGVRAILAPSVVFGRRPDRGAPGGGPFGALGEVLSALEADGLFPHVDAILSGYLASPEQAALVGDLVHRVKRANPNAFFVCDPVMGDGALYVSEGLAGTIAAQLAPCADLLAPNLFELERLSGRHVNNASDAMKAISTLGMATLASSIPTPAGVGVIYADATQAWLAQTPRLSHAPKGTGDLLSALFLARRLKRENVQTALCGAVGAVFDVCVHAQRNELDDLALSDAQHFLVTPETAPQLTRLD